MGGKGRHLSSKRAPARSSYARFQHTPDPQPAPRHKIALSTANAALSEHRTIFPSRVFKAGQVNRVLISGKNNSKIGARCLVGAWAGMPIYYLTLEERKTCPVSCHLYRECYGNALPMAQRVTYDHKLLMAIEGELDLLSWESPAGFIVRLHMLGDFPEISYVRWWRQQLLAYPALRIWGYTAWTAGTEIGDATFALNHEMPGRVAIRNTVRPEAEHDDWQVTTNWDHVEGRHAAGGIICPAEIPRPGGAVTCGECGLCWKESTAKIRIVFNGHGVQHHGPLKPKPERVPGIAPFRLPPAGKDDPAIARIIEEAVARGAVTKLRRYKTPVRIKVRD